MNIDTLKKQFPTEESCRDFFESVIWKNGRICPRCGCGKSWPIKSQRVGLYECGHCKHQFTVTVGTPFHGTKLPLWTWIKAIYFIANSSKGVSSVYLGHWVGVSQKTAWKIGHAIRKIMKAANDAFEPLTGLVELDEKFLGGKPRHEDGILHKRGKGTQKQCISVCVQRLGKVKAAPVKSDKSKDLAPHILKSVSTDAILMTDQNSAYKKIAEPYFGHLHVNHSRKEYARGPVHNNTAESYNGILERMRIGVFHYMSVQHLGKYIDDASFRWNHKIPEIRITKEGLEKAVKKPMPFMNLITIILKNAPGLGLIRSRNGGILDKKFFSTSNFIKINQPFFGL